MIEEMTKQNMGALMIRIGFWDILYQNIVKKGTPEKKVLAIIEAPVLHQSVVLAQPV